MVQKGWTKGHGELTERERNGGTEARRWRGSGGPVGRRGHEDKKRGEGGDGVLGRPCEGG
jgi:hypothetical protein